MLLDILSIAKGLSGCLDGRMKSIIVMLPPIVIGEETKRIENLHQEESGCLGRIVSKVGVRPKQPTRSAVLRQNCLALAVALCVGGFPNKCKAR